MTFVRRFLIVSVFLALPVLAFAQEATLTGTVTDSTGAVLPGVTVTAVNDATGNTFTGVTDERGIYRIPVRVGAYRITAELSGFTSVTQAGVPLLVGQTAALDLQMAPSTVQETVTVTADAPLLNVSTSSLGGNVDPQQVQELPVYGRNWMALALLAPGSRTSSTIATTPLPDRNGGEAREFQLNMDGQQVSNEIGTGAQPRYSQDAIAEFQFIANRFDATQGRTSGVQVNAITKSGTNQLTGLVRTNFRNSDWFDAKEPVLHRKVPFNNQQFSFAAGGPIVRDKLHYFGNFEYEREPRSSVWNTPYPVFNVELHGDRSVKTAGARGDYQLSTDTRLMVKGAWGRLGEPFGAGASNNSPAATNTNAEHNNEGIGQLTHVLSNRALNEVKVGYAFFNLANRNLTTWSNHWQKANGITTGSPRISFTGFNITGNQFHPRHQDQTVWTFRDDFTYSYQARGRHDLRAGGEFLKRHQIQANCRQCMGTIDARNGRPTEEQFAAWFPDWRNADTWNLAAISPLVRSYSIGLGDFNVLLDSQKAAVWAQDDWKISDDLTLNLGLRWDASLNGFANDVEVLPWQHAGRPQDLNNLQPRLGFAYQVADRTVVRGGSGLYYGDTLGADFSFATGNAQVIVIQYPNNGLPNFALDPTNGAGLPTYQQALTRFCYANNFAPGCLTRDLQEFVAPPEFVHVPRTWQTSIGIQQQFGSVTAATVDYVFSQGRDEKDVVDNVNLTFNPATGVNYPASDLTRRPVPGWGTVSMNSHMARSEYHALQTSLTKRLNDRWQASASYTLSWLYNADSRPFTVERNASTGEIRIFQVPFPTAPDLGGEWGISADDQRHRLVLNGIWEVGYGFQVSGLHYFGAGNRLSTNFGGDSRGFGGGGSGRLRPDGTIVPRNAFIGPIQNRTSLRLQQRIPLGGRRSIDGIAEIFNLFNRTNYTLGTQESQPANYLKPVSGQYRTAQFGFRFSF